MDFSHPLARAAKIWPSVVSDGMSQKLLVIVTTLELDAENKKFKKDKVERLKDAAREWLSAHAGEADGFLLMNRLKDWSAGPD